MFKVFISSNQTEFEKERQLIKKEFEEDYFLKSFFEVFLFEYSPASGLSPENTFFEEVRKSDIYIGLIGSDYGTIKENGLSATETHKVGMKKVKNSLKRFKMITNMYFLMIVMN